jgi:hypothetical protein
MSNRAVFLSTPDLLFFAAWCLGVAIGAALLLAVWHWLLERYGRRNLTR